MTNMTNNVSYSCDDHHDGKCYVAGFQSVYTLVYFYMLRQYNLFNETRRNTINLQQTHTIGRWSKVYTRARNKELNKDYYDK